MDHASNRGSANKKNLVNMSLSTTLRTIFAYFISTCGCFSLADPSPDVLAKLHSTVFKISSERGSGTIQAGSAVLVADGKLVTNCHVLAWAKKIQVIRDGERWPAKLIAADQEHDLCLLSAPGVPFVATATTNQLQIGQEVHAAGFPGGGSFNVSCGVVRALHTYDSANVIQTNANFAPGASGGGLFDRDGNLVGILTFRAIRGGDFHFVMPVDWVNELVARADAAEAERTVADAFYQRGEGKQPFFLQAAALEARQDWAGLLDVAQRWNNEQMDNTESLMAIGKACVALSKNDQAVSAFRQVLTLNAHHSLGKDWLLSLDPVKPCGDLTNPCLAADDILAFMEPVLP
jgi:serine protease Do